jgi:uncharacterized membrane protein YidH (DUF202 family)
MAAQKFIAILLIVAGVLALVYGGFTYTKEEHQTNIGPLHLEMNEKEHVNVPVWVGVVGVVLGASLLVIGRGRS